MLKEAVSTIANRFWTSRTSYRAADDVELDSRQRTVNLIHEAVLAMKMDWKGQMRCSVALATRSDSKPWKPKRKPFAEAVHDAIALLLGLVGTA